MKQEFRECVAEMLKIGGAYHEITFTEDKNDPGAVIITCADDYGDSDEFACYLEDGMVNVSCSQNWIRCGVSPKQVAIAIYGLSSF